ncbi:MAG: phosphatidate cytidylyltransferase [Prevotella sp.]
MKNFIVRTITGILFVVAVVTCFLKPAAMTLLFALITGLTVWEFTGLVNSRNDISVNRFISTIAGVYLYFAMTGFCSSLTPSTVFIPYLITLIYLLVAELYAKNSDPVGNWAYTMMSQLYVALPFSLLAVLAFRATADGVAYTFTIPLSVFVFLWMNDTGAYCCGSLLGRHKLFPRISPGKSWEGSIGGALLVMGVAAAAWHITETYGLNDLGLNLPEWIGLGLVVVVFGTWGDLVESLFKRTLGVKDSGTILPGHGGMLDRFDSSLLAIPAAVVYLYTLTLF